MKIKKICFVCNGNNSRSVMAEYIARNLWKQKMDVSSCGINANTSAEISQNTRTVLSEIGIEIPSRKRQKISEEFIHPEYYYFAMDNTIMEILINDFNISAKRVKFLAPRIIDPKDCSLDVYRECRNTLESAIQKIDLNQLFDFSPMPPKDYWDSVSDTKEFTTPFQAEAFANYVNLDAQILDVGCGYGRTLQQLHTMGYHNLTGIDFSIRMIERGKKQFPHLNLLVKENETIDFPDNQFDAVILFAVLTCIPSDKEQQTLIAEIRRVLKPGGILYINDFLLNSDDRNVNRYQKCEKQYGTYGVFELPEGAVLRHHSQRHIFNLTHAFSQAQFEPLTFTTMNGNRSNGFYYIGVK